MRTTLDIEDDALAAARELARAQRRSIGRVVSCLVRDALHGAGGAEPGEAPDVGAVGGFRPFPSRGTPVTNEQINDLRDHESYRATDTPQP